MPKLTLEGEICGLRVVVRKDHYNGLWNIVYADNGMKWAGGYKTRKEASERLARELED